ncbi:MAG: TonB-dependent receptor [Gammaproteobacteria bacterium]|nr:TonB-dependent receptor [Gammaproteobacteria bacterium]MBU6509426.1 TonB-dependent receptor [Gammaproteobacteria bacterium]MDE1983702.1 TonB-dependent receptor [Gammaproteobacteria bacterium]MDE2107902.1 TonB-dependent receptor [Gammaproteobacteria bacterium]MDE2460216.1 TonB-dependent receptor [Gammaproteobacteria bacterium]
MNSNLKRACRYALLTGGALALAVPSVFAQNAPAAGTSAQPAATQLGKVTVTGTAIPRTNVETPAPVTVITAKQIQESGLPTIADVVRTLSSDNSGTIPLAFTAGFANGSSGVALRGLTVNSTLVLIDGKRTAAYPLADDGERSFTDLNTIPLNAVERIEVLKDGASSIYGADAIAGVINIILYPSWTGSRATAQLGGSQHGGGASQDYTFITGTGNLDTNNWNAYLSVEYHTQRPVYNHNRKFPLDACDLSSVGYFDACVGGNPAFGGSGVGGSIYGVEAPATLGTPGNLLTGVQVPGTSFQPIRPCPTPVSYPGTGAGTGTGCTYNQVVNYDQLAPETKSYSVDGRITVNLNSTTTAYLNASYNQFRMESQSGQGASIQAGVPTNTDTIALPPTLPNGALNPNDLFASSGQYALIQYNFGDLPGFGWETDVNHVMRMDANVNGALSENWNYDAALNLNHAWLNVNDYGFLYFPQLMQDVTNGTYNFLNPSQNSQAVRNALSPTIGKTSTTDEDAADFTVNGPLTDLPGGPLALAVGVQWRYEAQDDPALNPGDSFQSLGNTQTIGHRNVSALFAELDAPVLPSLEMDLSGREDHYSDFGSAFSPKFGIKWTPIQQLMFRGTYSRGFRAPSFGENGSSSVLGFITFNPILSAPAWVNTHCATGSPPGTPTAPCTPDFYASPYGLGLFTGANPDIKPERARNYTLGMVFQPFAEFSGSLDYYNILKTNVIAPPATSALISAYFSGSPMPAGSVIVDTPDPLHPASLARPIQFNGIYANENELRTSGFDVNLRYDHDFGPLTWISNFNGTKIESWCETLTAGGPCVSMVGTQGPYILSSGAGTPKYRWNWANTLNFGSEFSATATVYWTSGMYMSVPDIFGPTAGCFSTGPSGNPVPPDCEMPAFWYVDLTGQWNINDNWALTAGILNATDKRPPFDPIDYAGNNYNPTYAQQGAMGRFYQIGLQVKF